MISSRQQAYLEAMDICVWTSRKQAAAPISSRESAVASHGVDKTPGLKLGPGGGGILLVCALDTDSATRLANDIGRALGSAPVWAWPHDESNAVELATAVTENLFTTVAIFGSELANRFFEEELPAGLNSASLVLLPAMKDIESRADARRTLWATFCRFGMVSKN